MIRLPFGYVLLVYRRASIAERLDRAYADQVRAIKNALAARNALKSPDYKKLIEAELAKDKTAFDATDQLTQLVRGIARGMEFAQQQRLDVERRMLILRAAFIRKHGRRPTADESFEMGRKYGLKNP